MNMMKWLEDVKTDKKKKALPLLSSPCVTLLNKSMRELTSDSRLQADGMALIAEKYDTLASVSMMDLSVEAEAFGAETVFSENDVPTIVGTFIDSLQKAEELEIPSLNSGRIGVYLNAIRLAKQTVTDRPVLAGVIGPFSLAGRLMNVSEAMIKCYDEPEMVHTVIEKATEFLISYILEYKKIGADGVIMAEPLAGMLSPTLAEEFSEPYVRKIIKAVQDDSFIIVYHNCGDNVNFMIDSIVRTGAAAYHFGNSVKMSEMLSRMPSDKIVMGNVDPAGVIRGGTPQIIKATVFDIMENCRNYPNFVISSGCDIPPQTNFENLDAFFEAVREFYEK